MISMNNFISQRIASPSNWKQSVLWLLFLGSFFFISYNFSNWLASQQAEVSHLFFSWEYSIPFVAWTIIPYWSIDILYIISLFICSTKKELNTHAKRLLTAQIIASLCFILFPMGYTFDRPETSGLYGYLFQALDTFDQPFNQAPSLHIALLVILWVIYLQHLPKVLHWPFHLLCVLIGISVLTCYQHHFIDIPTGALLGWFCIWLWPDNGWQMLIQSPQIKGSKGKHHLKIALYYLTPSIILSIIAISLHGWALWLFWPVLSLFMVASFYAFIGPEGFQKSSNGNLSLASQWLLFPYLFGTTINSALWNRRLKKNKSSKTIATNNIIDNLWLGHFPSMNEIQEQNYQTVIDMTAEMQRPTTNKSKEFTWHTLASLDLLPPEKQNLLKAVDLIELHINAKKNETILVSCALGYSRSVITVVIWLVLSLRVKTIEGAIELVKKKHPQAIIKSSDYIYLSTIINQTKQS